MAANGGFDGHQPSPCLAVSLVATLGTLQSPQCGLGGVRDRNPGKYRRYPCNSLSVLLVPQAAASS